MPRPLPSALPDPFDAVLLPPSNETAAERASRLQSEEEAKKISDEIDEAIKAEKNARNGARRKTVRVLMLGQSESGESVSIYVT